MFAEYIAIVERVRNFNKFAHFETRKSQEPFAMRALVVNLMTNEHKDHGDWQCGLAGLTKLYPVRAFCAPSEFLYP